VLPVEKDEHAYNFEHQIEMDDVSGSLLLKYQDFIGKCGKEPKGGERK